MTYYRRLPSTPVLLTLLLIWVAGGLLIAGSESEGRSLQPNEVAVIVGGDPLKGRECGPVDDCEDTQMNCENYPLSLCHDLHFMKKTEGAGDKACNSGFPEALCTETTPNVDCAVEYHCKWDDQMERCISEGQDPRGQWPKESANPRL